MTLTDKEKRFLDVISCQMELDGKSITEKNIINALKKNHAFIMEIMSGETNRAKKAKSIICSNMFAIKNLQD